MHSRSRAPCSGTCFEEIQLSRVQLMLDDERPVLDPPQALSGAERGDQGLLGAGESECCRGCAELVGLLAIDDAGFGVREKR